MATSEKKIEANRRNAKKSTGPRTVEGKEKSSRNALKHGGRSEKVFVADVDQKALDQEIDDWKAHYQPENPVQQALVIRGAVASVRLSRCAKNEGAKLDERRRNAVRRWHLDRKKEVEGLAARLPFDPIRIAPALRETPEGCTWMIARWMLLRIALEGRGYWTTEEFSQGLHLLGRGEQAHRRDLLGCRFTAAHLAAFSGRSLEKAASEGLLSADQGRKWLERKCLGESKQLRRQREALRVDRSLDLARAAEQALFDDAPGAVLMRRYESAAMTDLWRCVTLLARLKGEDGPRVERPRSRSDQPDAGSKVLGVGTETEKASDSRPLGFVAGVGAPLPESSEPGQLVARRGLRTDPGQPRDGGTVGWRSVCQESPNEANSDRERQAESADFQGSERSEVAISETIKPLIEARRRRRKSVAPIVLAIVVGWMAGRVLVPIRSGKPPFESLSIAGPIRSWMSCATSTGKRRIDRARLDCGDLGDRAADSV